METELLINFLMAGYEEDVICHPERTGRAVNSSGSQQMVNENGQQKNNQPSCVSITHEVIPEMWSKVTQ